jgi:hypothetical protein
MLNESCVFHTSSSLLKSSECSEIRKIGLVYRIKYKVKPVNIPSESNLNNFFSPLYTITFDTIERIKFSEDYCEIIKTLKNIHLRKNESHFFKKRRKLYEKDTVHYFIMSIILSGKDDELAITPIDGRFRFIYIGESYRGLSNHSDKLWEYASANYFDDIKLQEKLISFADKMIEYRNEQVRRDITLYDSLRQPYPLIILPK